MRPPSIVNFERVVVLSIVISVINTFIVWDRMMPIFAARGLGPGVVLGLNVAIIALYGLLIWLISRRGSTVAKWIYIVLAGFGLVYGLLGIGQVAANGPLLMVITLAQYGLTALSIWLLFRPDANAWFRGENPGDPGVFS
jgi:hypothetical protein